MKYLQHKCYKFAWQSQHDVSFHSKLHHGIVTYVCITGEPLYNSLSILYIYIYIYLHTKYLYVQGNKYKSGLDRAAALESVLAQLPLQASINRGWGVSNF